MLKIESNIHDGFKEIFLSNFYEEFLFFKLNKFKRRSHLFIPMTKVEAYIKNIDCGADTIIFDLEDSVNANFKALARDKLELLPARKSMEYVIRINEYLTKDFELDIEALSNISNSFDTISLSKVELPKVIEVVKNSFPHHNIVAFMETPLGVNNAFLLAKLLGKDDGLGFGAGDYAMRFGISRKPIYESDTLKFAALQVASAAHQYGLDFIDTVSRPFSTQASEIVLRRESIWSRDNTGAIGKRAIHPSQIAIINDVFSPTTEQIQTEVDLLNIFAKSGQTNAIKKPESTYSGTPQFKTALNRLNDWLSRGYIKITTNV